MAKPLPLPVWDRRAGKLVMEFMDDHKLTYESEPSRSIKQWIKSQPLIDWLYAAYENTRWSAREIEPLIRKYHIDMSEFEPIEYRSFAEFFRPTIQTRGPQVPRASWRDRCIRGGALLRVG
jgi:phosphatidylserine decarboxylase